MAHKGISLYWSQGCGIYDIKGHYPERYEMSVTQEAFVGSQVPGADFEVFKDLDGRFIGSGGSHYAYVPALSDVIQKIAVSLAVRARSILS